VKLRTESCVFGERKGACSVLSSSSKSTELQFNLPFCLPMKDYIHYVLRCPARSKSHIIHRLPAPLVPWEPPDTHAAPLAASPAKGYPR
jgi:hypothetical protein